jgi:8-oxo-dGTP pyrophosphatase MutT (NUDIX family)
MPSSTGTSRSVSASSSSASGRSTPLSSVPPSGARTPSLPAKVPTTLLLSSEFVICAGCILFRHIPPNPLPLQVCLLRQPVRNEWLLPKGRKDRGESLECTALRETFEETGYPPVLLPVRMYTRAPDPTINLKDGAPGVLVEACKEPFASAIRYVGARNLKLVYWFIARVDDGPDVKWPREDDGEVKRVEDTMMDSECFESEWVNVKEAEDRLTFENDREIVRTAISLVTDTYIT